MPNIIKLFIALITFFNTVSSVYANGLTKMYFSVDKLEIYGITNKDTKLWEVKYFEGKIFLTEENGEFKCISTKSNEDYLQFQNTGNNALLITSTIFKNCHGTIAKDQLFEKQLSIKLENKDVLLKYYLRKLSTDNEIFNSIKSGTGILLGKTTILTNYHVVNGANKITIDYDSKIYNLSLINYDASLDIAVLKIDGVLKIDNQLLNFSIDDVDIGEQTYVSGFPMISTMGSQLKFTSGIISSLSGFNDDIRYLQTTAPIDPGNSGGPLINRFGNIVGIVSAKHNDGTNVGYALKIKYLLKEKFITQTNYKKLLLTPQQIYIKAKNSVCIIKSFTL